MVKCANCKSENENDSFFCGECGQNISQPPSLNQPPNIQGSVTISDIEKSKFFTFASPFINKIDGGQFFKNPFRWIYILNAITNIISPLYIFYLCIDNNIFKNGGFGSVIIFLFFSFSCWIGFQLWWDRKTKLNHYISSGDEFVAIPVFSHFFQTMGEWYGVIIGIVSIGIGLATMFSNEAASYAENGLYLPSIAANKGGWIIIYGPMLAFFVVVFTRCIAEAIRALASIANNTKKK